MVREGGGGGVKEKMVKIWRTKKKNRRKSATALLPLENSAGTIKFAENAENAVLAPGQLVRA